MNNASLELGGTNWAEKEGSLLGYAVNDTNNKYSAKEFTFGRGTNLSATRIGKTGLIEKGRENVLLQSNGFDTNWSTSSALALSGYAGKNGGTNAWLLREQGSTSPHWIRQSSGLTSGIGTFSFYAKKKDYDWIQFGQSGDGGDYANFNISNGTLGNSTSGFIDTSITSVGNGWYRCSVTYSFGSNSFVGIALIRSDVSSRYETYQGDNISGTYIQDAQVELGLAASPYIPTTTTTAQAGVLENTPRLNYTTGVANPYLLLEPSRTNLIPQSEYFGGSDWNKTATTIVDNATTSPDGYVNASKLVEDTSTGGHQIQKIITVSAATIYTTSVFVKYAGREWIRFTDAQSSNRIHFNTLTGVFGTSTGTVIDYNSTALGDGWHKLSLTTTSVGTAYTPRITLAEADNDISYTGDGTSGVYIYGAQLEAGSYPTSYIPTYSVSATRVKDFFSKTNASGEIGQTEGTIFLDFKLPKVSTPQNHTWVSLKNASENDRVLIYMLSNSSTLRAQIKASGTATNFNLGDISDNERIKVAVAYKSGSTSIYVNGVSVAGSSVALSFGTMDIIDSNQDAPFEGDLNQLQVFTTRLINTELATLTTI